MKIQIWQSIIQSYNHSENRELVFRNAGSGLLNDCITECMNVTSASSRTAGFDRLFDSTAGFGLWFGNKFRPGSTLALAFGGRLILFVVNMKTHASEFTLNIAF
jgi:hypothetical protein